MTITASSAFRAAVAAGVQRSTASMDVLVRGTTSQVQRTILPVDAEVSVDRTRLYRRTITATFVDYAGDLVPTSPDSLLAPYGTEVTAYRGAVLPDGSTEVVQLGVFVLTGYSTADDGDGVQVTVEGVDRSFRISANRFIDYSDAGATFATGPTLTNFITTVAVSRYPQVQLRLPEAFASLSLPPVTFDVAGEADPWQVMVDVCFERGWDLYFDNTGVLTATQIIDPDVGQVAATYVDDGSSVLLDVTADVSTEEAVNVIVATAEPATGAPLRSVAYDSNPQSPTYYLGPFGTRPLAVASETITTATDLATFAATTLAQEKGARQDVSWNMLVDPTLEPGDVISITRGEVGLNARTFVVDAVTIPLSPDRGMAVRARTRTAAT